jgi:hypothetical protein
MTTRTDRATRAAPIPMYRATRCPYLNDPKDCDMGDGCACVLVARPVPLTRAQSIQSGASGPDYSPQAKQAMNDNPDDAYFRSLRH